MHAPITAPINKWSLVFVVCEGIIVAVVVEFVVIVDVVHIDSWCKTKKNCHTFDFIHIGSWMVHQGRAKPEGLSHSELLASLKSFPLSMPSIIQCSKEVSVFFTFVFPILWTVETSVGVHALVCYVICTLTSPFKILGDHSNLR